jgi:hypothetical protein
MDWSTLLYLFGNKGQEVAASQQTNQPQKPWNQEAWSISFNNILNSLYGMQGGKVPEQNNVFGGEKGNQLSTSINDMLSGKAATDMGGAIQRQTASALSMQMDKLASSLNPALRGSGLQAQMGKDLTVQSNSSLYDALAGLKGNMFTQGTSLLGNLQGQQAGQNQNAMLQLMQLLAGMQ